jgi:hypothetical protein
VAGADAGAGRCSSRLIWAALVLGAWLCCLCHVTCGPLPLNRVHPSRPSLAVTLPRPRTAYNLFTHMVRYRQVLPRTARGTDALIRTAGEGALGFVPRASVGSAAPRFSATFPCAPGRTCAV